MNRTILSRALLAAVAVAALAAGTNAQAAKANKVRSAAAPASTPKPATDSGLVPTASFDTFRVVVDRNIFNSVRTGRTSRDAGGDTGPRGDTLALVGTMDSDKGLYAFFDSTDPRLAKAVHEGDSLPPFKVTRITADAVELENNGRKLTLRMAQQLRRPDATSEWTLVNADVAQPLRPDASAAAAAPVNTPPAIPADASEALRRLMEQRQKQLKQ